ncbi:ATP-binding cassette domain-containing protein [Xylophilus sp. Kf1]|nr:ATP-binding cassette domain-containing protein [Xylophilus sp. Kf1]
MSDPRPGATASATDATDATTAAPAPRRIALDGVDLQRGSRPVFAGLTLALHESRIGLIGDNGAGKSSLFRLIAGLDAPQRGTVRVHGLDTRTDRHRLPRHIGLMFQNPEDQIIFPTVVEEVAFSLSAQGLARPAARARALAFLQARGLGDWAGRAIAELSQGQRQQVCLAALQIAGPDTLLLDEPYASLDLPSQERLSAQLRASDRQIILSTHVLDHLRDFERVVWLDQGRVRADGPAGAVCEAYVQDVRQRSRHA